jgi:hypothetical protein
MLEAMGRETVFVDAVGAPPPRSDNALNPGTDMVHSPRGTRSTALLQQMTQEASAESVVVSDTAPLLVSGETEYLARFVDASIVVVESGVTTRAQLREVARTLQRLDVSAVGFVLNRIPLAKADPAFRQSVHAVETRLHVQASVYERPPAIPVAAPERPSRQPSRPPRASAGLDRLWKLSEDSAHESTPSAAPGPVEEPETPAPAAEVARQDPAQQEDSAHVPWEHPSVQPAPARKKSENPADEPAYRHFLHPAPSAAVDAAATHAVAVGGRGFEEPAFIGHEAAATPPVAADPIPREQVPAPPEVPYIAPEPLSRPEPVFHAPQPPDYLDMPDYIVRATAPVERELPSYLRPARETEPPRAEAPKPESPSVKQPQPGSWPFEAVAPQPAAAVPAPMPDSLPDSPMETLPPNAAWTPPAEGGSPVKPFVAHPMRGREPLRPFAAESRPAAPPPAETVPMPEPEPEAAPPPRRDSSVTVMPPIPSARKREAHPKPHQEPPVIAVPPPPAAHPVEEIRPADAADRDVHKPRIEEETLFPFPQRPPEWHVAASPQPAPHPSHIEEPDSSSDGPGAETEDLPYSAASRLGGLRNLLVSLGLKNLHREDEFRTAPLETEPPRIPERPVYAQPANAPEGAPEPETVVARPEIIPPRIAPESSDRATDPVRPVKPPRVSRWDSADDVETLPSRRGQYRRR